MSEDERHEAESMKLAGALKLSEEDTARLVAAYPAWNARQMPEDDRIESHGVRFEGEVLDWFTAYERHAATLLDGLPTGAVVILPDEAMFENLVRLGKGLVITPDPVLKKDLKPVPDLTAEDLEVLWVERKKLEQDVRSQARLMANLGEHMEDGETFGEFFKRRSGGRRSPDADGA